MEKQDTKLGMKPFIRKHRESFINLVDIVYSITQGVDIPIKPKRSSWASILYCRKYPSVPLPISREDVIAELFIIWDGLEKKFFSKGRDPHRKKIEYILGYTPFLIRDWIIKEERNYITPIELSKGWVERMSPWWLQEETNFSGEERSPVAFLFGKEERPLKKTYLSNWDRQLIYLNYMRDKSLRDMVAFLQKDRATLSMQMKHLERRINQSVGSQARYKGSVKS